MPKPSPAGCRTATPRNTLTHPHRERDRQTQTERAEEGWSPTTTIHGSENQEDSIHLEERYRRRVRQSQIQKAGKGEKEYQIKPR